MEKSYDVQAIETAYERIISERVFKRSSLQERILRYLIDQALAGNDVTEHTIGIELFKEKYTVDQNDSKIRVYVFYLRKKLSEYYNDQGKDESIIFNVDKGQYNLSFKENSKSVDKAMEGGYIHLRLPKKLFLSSLIAAALAISIFIVSHFYKPASIWNPFLSDNTLCVIADHYMIADHSNENNYCFSTYKDIHTESDVREFNRINPELNLIPASFTMTTKMASFGIYYLSQWFNYFQQTFDVQLESDTQYSDYIKKNVIYIGQAKKMQASKTFFLRNSKVFGQVPNGYVFHNKNKNISYTGTHDDIASEEYAMVSYQKLDNGMFNLFFVSNHDIGVMSTIKLFTTQKRLKAFTNKLPSVDTEFNALFKVSGLKRTEMTCELVELEIVSD